LGAFSRQARKEGWTEEEIDVVLNDARSGAYNHLLTVLVAHCEDVDEDGDFDEDEES
jgi:hypothetical protein